MEESRPRQFMCFVCSNNIEGDFHSLFFHLRTIHAITYSGNYFVCAQNGCQRTFHSVWPYKRHLIKHVLEQDSNNDSFMNDVPGEVFDYNGESEDMINSGDDVNMDGVNDLNTGQSLHAELDVMSIASSFISKLKAKANLPLSTLNTVIECTSEMCSEIIEALQGKTKKVVEDLRKGMRNDDDFTDLLSDFEESRRPFAGLETGWLQNKYFLDRGTFIPPVSVPLGVAFNPQPDPHTGVVLQRQKRDTFEYVPIRELLLEVLDADMLQMIQQYKTREQEPGILEDFKDGSYYKSNPTLCDPETINILLYFDELETTNPFSPKAGTHKLGLFYFTLKDVHPVHQSSLKNMFLLAVALSKDIKHYGFNAILNPIVDDLKVLDSEGLVCDGRNVRVVLGQTTGDNLGLHGMLGFAEGFTANFPCRRCSMPRDDAHTATTEDDALIRTVETYDRDIAIDDVSRTGVKRMCPLNDLVGYHVTDNHVFDIMHDILEGVGLIEVKLVLKAIITEGVLTLDVINDRIVSFDYGFPESSNKPCVITEQSLKRATSATGQKAEQAYFLIRYLPILIGDLVTDGRCDDHMHLIHLLLSCMDIIFSPEISEEETYYLQRLIQEHHDHFLTTFPDNHLLPKHHHMLHYPAAIRAIGPLQRFSSMRFEGKHAFFKQIAQVTCNFKNICKTMARRHQMTLSDTLLRKELFKLKPMECGKGWLQPLDHFEPHQGLIAEAIGCPVDSEVFSAKFAAKHYGVEYRLNEMVTVDSDKESGHPIYGKIQHVFIDGGILVYMLIRVWETLWFEDRYHAYAIREGDQFLCITVNELIDYHPFHLIKSFDEHDSLRYIVPRHR